MTQEFEDYWEKHQRQLILGAPEPLRTEYLESNKLDSPLDWLCFVIPIGVGIAVQSCLRVESEIVSWSIVLVVVVLLFAVMQMIKPYVTKKKTTQQVINEIKEYYYQKYLETGDLKQIDPLVMT